METLGDAKSRKEIRREVFDKRSGKRRKDVFLQIFGSSTATRIPLSAWRAVCRCLGRAKKGCGLQKKRIFSYSKIVVVASVEKEVSTPLDADYVATRRTIIFCILRGSRRIETRFPWKYATAFSTVLDSWIVSLSAGTVVKLDKAIL